ncbi:hypothetical protein CCR75_006202 [Bremia lactucae]|uniref:Histone-lysine N-methyltransferase, H3 lysine-79 specific n=1 Tax=Bremia lactucae TaxID=4779 RepID=A0A976ICX6_BRELC|nr:hypothetical protein CCR75_006202 [Bremia lactucae]
MTPRRRPANRRGPRSAEHLKLSSPHLLYPQANSLKSSLRLKHVKMGRLSSPHEKTPSKVDGEDASDTSTTTSFSSEGDTTSFLHNAQQLQRKNTASVERYSSVPLKTRFSRRNRRTVDASNPLRCPLLGRRSLNKRQNIETSKLDLILSARPAAAATAAACAEAAENEKKRNKMIAKMRGRPSPQNSSLPQIEDEKTTTFKIKRLRKVRHSLEPAYSFESQTKYVSRLIADLYEEQEQDDREVYNISKETVFTETSACKRSQEVQGLSVEEFRRLMTYGEVSVESVASKILPMLNLVEDDVFFDLGCGTGKILVQTSLQTPCRRAIGIELMHNRVVGGHKALVRLQERNISILQGKETRILQGDIFMPPAEACLMDATVVFINNVMFGPQLMLKVLQLLNQMPKLRCVMTLRKICERHGHEKCSRAGNYCIDYVQPPTEEEIDVSWADKASVYLYESVNYSVKQLTRKLASGVP